MQLTTIKNSTHAANADVQTQLFPHLELSTALQKRNLSADNYIYQGHLTELFKNTNCALCITDIQRDFCDVTHAGTPETEAIIPSIVQLKETFNQNHKPVFVIYKDSKEAGIEQAGGGLYGINADQQSDITIAKDSDSVFKASRYCQTPHISKYLEDLQISTLFFVGTHFSLCASKSAIDASKQYNSFIVEDCVADGQTYGCGDPYTTLQQTIQSNIQYVSKNNVIQSMEHSMSAEYPYALMG